RVRRSSNLQADQTVVIGSAGEIDRAISILYGPGNLGQHVLRVRTAVSRTIGERGHSGITGREPLAFRREGAIRSTGTNNDPVLVVALLGGQFQITGVGGSRLELNGISALGVVDRRLRVASGIDLDKMAGRGRVGHRTGNGHAR